MAFQVPFGQYLPGQTSLHKLDARVKFACAAVFTFVLFACNSWWAMGLLTIITLLGYLIATIPFKVAARALKPLLLILLFTILANGLTFAASSIEGAVVIIGNFGIDPWGILDGFYFSLRICLLVLGTSLITFTTNSIALADALTSLMNPLRFVHVPVEDIARMFSIALCFIPITTEEAEKVIIAQKSRGACFDQGGIGTRVRAWIPVLIPLFVGLFRRADDLACAMEARCYTGVGRTRLKEQQMRGADWTVLACAVIICSAVIVALAVL